MLARLVPIDAKFFSSLSIARKEIRKVHFITVATIRRGDTNEKFEAFGKNIRGEEEIKHFENSLGAWRRPLKMLFFSLSSPPLFISFWVGKIWGLKVCIVLKTVHFFLLLKCVLRSFRNHL